MRKLDERAEALIQEGLELQASILEKKQRLEFVERQIGAYLPGASHVESLPTIEGTAIRVLDERMHVIPIHLPDVAAMLGSNFDKYFAIAPRAIPTPQGLMVLSDADSRLGHDLRQFVQIKRQWIVHFSPSKLGRVINLTPEELA